eukprot:gene26036-31438_t
MQIIVDPTVKSLFVEEVFEAAINNAVQFMTRSEVKDVFARYITDFEGDGFNDAIKETYTLDVIKQKSEVLGFCCVYPIDSLKAVYFNPCLLTGIMTQLARFSTTTVATAESESEEPKPKRQKKGEDAALRPQSREELQLMLVLFITAKLIHELCHLVHRKSSASLRASNETPPKIRKDTMVNGTEKDVAYTDFGALMELELLGGCWELSNATRNMFMVPQFVVIYPSADTKVGRYLNSQTSYIDARGAHIVAHGEHQSTIKPSFSATMLSGGPARMSQVVGKSHSGSFDENEVEEEAEEDFGGGKIGARL